MAWRIGPDVVILELANLKKNTTHGYFGLDGDEGPTTFELVGDPDPGLAGRHVRFLPAGSDPADFERAPDELEIQVDYIDESAEAGPVELPEDFPSPPARKSKIHPQQIGPAGTITYHMVRVPKPGVSIEEAYKSGKPLETDWKPCLYFEWFSQNGRVVIELIDPIVIVREGDPVPVPEIPQLPEGGGMSFSILGLTEEGEGHARTFEMKPHDEPEEQSIDDYLESRNREKERSFRGEGEDSFLEELRRIDNIIENEDGEFVASILHPQHLPAPHDVDEERASTLVKSLCGELALFGVALHVCQHFTMKEAYRFIVESLLFDARIHPDLRGTGWVQHFMTHDACPECAKEFEEPAEEGGPPGE